MYRGRKSSKNGRGIKETLFVTAGALLIATAVYGRTDAENIAKTTRRATQTATASASSSKEGAITGSGLREIKIVTLTPGHEEANDDKPEQIDFDLRHLKIVEPEGREAAYEKAQKEAETEREETILPVLTREPDGTDGTPGEEGGSADTEVEGYGDADSGVEETPVPDDTADDADTGMAETAVHTDDEAETVNEGEVPEDTVEPDQPDYEYLGTWTATAYCGCEICCGDYATGYTASGTLATEGRTVACNSLPFGTQIMIDGNIYTVEDTGYSPYGDAWLDIFYSSHDSALAYGMRSVEVYLVRCD